MKKTLFYTALLFAGTVLMTGCGKDDEKGETFSDQTVEQHKANLEKDGIAVIQEMEGISNLQAVKAAQAFMELMNNDNANLSATKAMAALASENDTQLPLKVAAALTQSQMEFNEQAGIYTWTPAKNDFVKTTNTGEITYLFPSEGSSTNDLSFTINNLKTSVPSKITEDVYELLKSVTMTVKSNNTAILTFSIIGEYNSNDEPTLLKESLLFTEGYELSNTITNNGSKVSMEQAFKKGTSNIISYYFEVNGNINYNDASNTMEGEDSNMLEQDVVNSTLMYIAVGNFKAEGSININGMLNDMKNNETMITKLYVDEEQANKGTSMLNNYVNLAVKYYDSNDIICKCKFFTDEEYDEWSETTYYSNDMAMEFADGSKVDDSFFGKGFTDFINDVNELVDSINNNYETDLDID
ncbi:hypothetical protein LX69_00724 [Breznakibacter xylanolyticus]|uniref:Lipoprotein n=1 Tax=Breznakibacter xylanolyticus TaxID=990 RepID=A0A2W7NMX3_9BACT|nr:hypothetical protein [Breznakibacter xylanolyticus]PZX19457.1 hypothetical protein LX69_00724 [Breznakibacter xylanolyticus]